jgi:hypothetical protein
MVYPQKYKNCSTLECFNLFHHRLNLDREATSALNLKLIRSQKNNIHPENGNESISGQNTSNIDSQVIKVKGFQ